MPSAVPSDHPNLIQPWGPKSSDCGTIGSNCTTITDDGVVPGETQRRDVAKLPAGITIRLLASGWDRFTCRLTLNDDHPKLKWCQESKRGAAATVIPLCFSPDSQHHSAVPTQTRGVRACALQYYHDGRIEGFHKPIEPGSPLSWDQLARR